MRKNKIILLQLFIISYTIFGYSQTLKKYDYLSELKKEDVSDIWILNKFQTEFEFDTTYVERAQPLGYIGENYQRFYIHFNSVIQNPINKLTYFVYGKSKVKKNICEFQGLIEIKSCEVYFDEIFPNIKQGIIKGEYEFYENPKEKGSGIFKGTFETEIYIDKKGKINYNTLYFVADGYQNNQFEGIWSSYTTKESKKCNWGDYRIPDSKNLDFGAGEFGVSDKYIENGWSTYMIANNGIKSN